MTAIIRNSLMVLMLAGLGAEFVPGLIHAEGRSSCCCDSCRQPCGRCRCHSQPTASRPLPEAPPAPVCQEREVTETEYRTEQTYETVPTTVMETVTVDEGCYQTVWVPRLTSRQVPKTVYSTRSAYRSVPYQVTKRVNECTLPDGTVSRRYPAGGSSATAYSTAPGYAVRTPTPAYSSSSVASRSYPTPVASSSAGRVPEPRYAEAPVTSITPRSAASTPRYNNESAADSRVADRSSMFVPAPSAAQVWRTNPIR
ncbi:MAG: hypothetical protein JSS02_20730 [Planctomycetes bacterium]|nr:hypothetical protein [Planctomycetota bacterium]